MSNILVKTEALDDTSEWTQSDLLTVTANTDAAPLFAGINAGLADRLVDSDASNIGTLFGGFHTITSDGTDWLLSVYGKKDTVTTRFPLIYVDMQNGTRVQAYASLDTKNGLISNASGAPVFDAIGVIDIDSLWWRFWGRIANNNTGNNAIRCSLIPAGTLLFGGTGEPAAQGTYPMWGVNLTNTSTIQPYEPDPLYAFATSTVLPFSTQIGAKRFR